MLSIAAIDQMIYHSFLMLAQRWLKIYLTTDKPLTPCINKDNNEWLAAYFRVQGRWDTNTIFLEVGTIIRSQDFIQTGYCTGSKLFTSFSVVVGRSKLLHLVLPCLNRIV